MYLSRLFTALLLGVALVAAMSLFALVLALAFLPGLDQLPQVLARYGMTMCSALPLWMASAGLFLSLKFIFRSGALAGVLEALYYLVGFPIVGAAATVVPADTGEPGPISTLLYALHPMTPFWNGDMVVEGIDTGISIQLTPEAFVDSPPPMLYCWALGLLWLIGTSLVAIAFLQRRELR